MSNQSNAEPPALQPYQVLFPLGILHAWIGVIYWLFYLSGQISYPLDRHATAMIGGFLGAFISGFILTAIPKFSRTKPTTRLELSISASIQVFILFAHLTAASPFVFHLLILINQIYLLAYYLIRWKFRPAPHLILVHLGMVLGVIGGVLVLVQPLSPLGKTLLYRDSLLCIVLGIGQRIVSAILGRGPKLHTPWGVFFLFLLATVMTSLGWNSLYAQVSRFAAIAWVAFRVWRIHHRPSVDGHLPRLMWVVTYGLLSGAFLPLVRPEWGISGDHLLYVSGFGLLTLMTATRVTLAHGGYPLNLEYRSATLMSVALLLVCATVTRLGIVFESSLFTPLILASASLWVLGVSLWANVFLPKIVRTFYS